MVSYKNLPCKLVGLIILAFGVSLQNCSENESGKKPNKKEIIDAINIDIWIPGVLEPYSQFLYDPDGDGTFEPDDLYPTLLFQTNVTYSANMYYVAGPEGDLSEEINDEKDDHLFCYEVTNNVISVTYKDEDSNDLPFGWQTEWTTGDVEVTGQLTITLRHQPGTKTGDCSTAGEVDFQVVIPIEVSN